MFVTRNYGSTDRGGLLPCSFVGDFRPSDAPVGTCMTSLTSPHASLEVTFVDYGEFVQRWVWSLRSLMSNETE